MITNLFSNFDPSTSMWLSLNWMSLIMPIIFFKLNYWTLNSRTSIMWNLFNKYIFNEFKMLMKNNKINLIIFVSMMIYLMLINLLSMMPYTFTPTSHLSMNLSLSMSLWISFMIYGWMNFTNQMLTHLVPLNTPSFLMNFMVIIETISNIIRPWTLSIRLTANMLAGHLLITLLSSSINNNVLIMFMSILSQMMLMVLEISVTVIQAYVFSILNVLYLNETNY